jgi:phosphopantothenoylcysteine decarboxylase/phosphopantothenate--cysteine ligase
VSGPTSLEAPLGVRLVEVTSAREMHEAVFAECDDADFVCKAAAVCDIRPSEASEQKLDKATLDTSLVVERNPDILAELGAQYGAEQDGPLLIGFAAESRDMIERGKKKRVRKGAHMMVANKIGGQDSAFAAERSQIAIISDDGVTECGPASKYELAGHIWRVAVELKKRRSDRSNKRGQA